MKQDKEYDNELGELTPDEERMMDTMDATVDDADTLFDKVKPARPASDNDSRGM